MDVKINSELNDAEDERTGSASYKPQIYIGLTGLVHVVTRKIIFDSTHALAFEKTSYADFFVMAYIIGLAILFLLAGKGKKIHKALYIAAALLFVPMVILPLCERTELYRYEICERDFLNQVTEKHDVQNADVLYVGIKKTVHNSRHSHSTDYDLQLTFVYGEKEIAFHSFRGYKDFRLYEILEYYHKKNLIKVQNKDMLQNFINDRAVDYNTVTLLYEIFNYRRF